VWRELCVQNDHLFEAVICAYTGYLWARDGWSEVQHIAAARGREEGWIWVPPSNASVIAPTASVKR